MCGIAGYNLRRPVAHGVLEDMVGALRHRGPDSVGFCRAGEFGGGMSRLSINDIAGGNQPLYGDRQNVVLFYNGEIYNYPELRRKLEAKGHTFRTHSDGEVICHLYEHYGEDLFEHLDGMFAAALWVADERKLILARDLPGEKPLYYSEPGPGEVVFASEISALRRFPEIDLTLNRQAVWDFPTFLWVPEPATIFSAIKALPRGHLLVVQAGATKLKAYQNKFNIQPLESLSDDFVVRETRRVVEEAVRSRLLSDVPIGSFLSGGLDSSIVATIAARDLEKLDTFSIGFEDLHDPYHGNADESVAAAQTAKLIGSKHHSIRVTADTFRGELAQFCRHGDQPFAVSSGLGILAVAHAARQVGLKVLLSGDGADEAFGGYSWYSYLAGRDRDGSAAPQGVVSFQNFGVPIGARLAAIDALPPQAQAWAWHYYAHEDEKASLFAGDFQDGLMPSLRHFDTLGRRTAPVDFIDQDREFYFPNEMLTKLDRMTMAYSVEGRAPFAAPAVLSHARKLQYRHMVAPDGTLKHALRRAFADILPEEVVARPKHGFNVPIDHWLKNGWSDLVDATFAPDSGLNRLGIISPNAGQVAKAMLHDKQRLNGHSIFCMIMLNDWIERGFHGNHR